MGRKTLWRTFSVTDHDAYRRLHSCYVSSFEHQKANGQIVKFDGRSGLETNMPLAEVRTMFSFAHVRMPDYLTDTMALDEHADEQVPV